MTFLKARTTLLVGVGAVLGGLYGMVLFSKLLVWAEAYNKTHNYLLDSVLGITFIGLPIAYVVGWELIGKRLFGEQK